LKFSPQLQVFCVCAPVDKISTDSTLRGTCTIAELLVVHWSESQCRGSGLHLPCNQ